MSNYKGLFTFDINNHKYVSVDQADGIIDFMNYQPEIKEEQKGYWYINEFGTPTEITHTRENIYDKQRKNFGNYFETKEEAEQAVEKLKAWKLLRDECNIKFDGIIRDHKAMLKGVKLSYDRHTVTFDRMRECTDALYLIFGGEK